MRKIISILLIGVCIASCKDKNALPANLLSKQQMGDVLWDITRAEVFTNNYIKKDSGKNLVVEDAKLQQQIFDIHHVTKDQFYTSYDYYRKNPELISAILDSISVNNSRMQAAQGTAPAIGQRSPNRHFPNERAPFFKDSAMQAKFNHTPVPIKH